MFKRVCKCMFLSRLTNPSNRRCPSSTGRWKCSAVRCPAVQRGFGLRCRSGVKRHACGNIYFIYSCMLWLLRSYLDPNFKVFFIFLNQEVATPKHGSQMLALCSLWLWRLSYALCECTHTYRGVKVYFATGEGRKHVCSCLCQSQLQI